ncbi:MAG TPA: hypothetical protein VF595_13215 [Tepidisphaeraceae bacterium]|jgi:hypothetical protein
MTFIVGWPDFSIIEAVGEPIAKLGGKRLIAAQSVRRATPAVERPTATTASARMPLLSLSRRPITTGRPDES